MLAIVPYKLANSTLLTVLEYLKIVSASITPFEAKITGASLAEYFPDPNKHDLRWRKTINACLHLLDPKRFDRDYPNTFNACHIPRTIRALKVKYSKPIADDVGMLIDNYLNNKPTEVIPIKRDHMRVLAKQCSRSSIPLKLYLLIAIRTIHKTGKARINQIRVAQILGCSTDQIQRAQEFLISLGLIKKEELSPVKRIRHGVSLSIV